VYCVNDTRLIVLTGAQSSLKSDIIFLKTAIAKPVDVRDLARQEAVKSMKMILCWCEPVNLPIPQFRENVPVTEASVTSRDI
jgi:hypothetical protein